MRVPERREKFGEGEGYYCFFIEESRFQDRLNAQEARGKGVEQPAGGWTRGVIAACSRHPRRLVQTQRRVISRGVGGGERRQSGALEKRLSAVKNAAELLVCLARYKRPGSWCAFRNKHAATARPPVLWRNPRSEKKERNVPGKNRLPFSSSSSYTCSSGLHSRLTIWSQFFEDWTWTNRSFFLSLFSEKKYRSGECFSPRRIFRWNNRRGLKNLKISRRSVSLLFLAIMVMDKSLRNKSELPLRK